MRSKRYKIEKECIEMECPGIEKEGRFQRRKAMGRLPSVIHGSPIGKPEINRDPVSSGERERIGGLKKNKHEASFLSKVFTYFSPGFIRFVVDWMMEKNQQAPLLESKGRSAVNCNCEKIGRSGQKKVIAL
ncbi:hypothetical protein Salat_2963500 [Sesamum alatum]|uniref:Uncharacterized protein n=1 Tax=Sesamum alatum TaxID=300844 RepID=A0AAE1XHX4_9LAMI|nr:hypothetical protein Salat_2963500 [Sesamum alatum]